MAEPYIGEICIFGFNFAPVGWSSCEGQHLPIQQNAALYSLLGVQFGGNGTTDFVLPDLRGRLPLGAGVRPLDNANFLVGAVGGAVTQTGQGNVSFALNANNLPAHNHPATLALTSTPTTVTVSASKDNAALPSPGTGNYIASNVAKTGAGAGPVNAFVATATAGTVPLGGSAVSGGVTGGTVTVGNTGAGQPVVAPFQVAVNTANPYLALKFCIAMEGIYPQRP